MSDVRLPSADLPRRTVIAPQAAANLIALAALIAPPLALFAPLGEAGLLALLASALLALDPRGSFAACRAFAAPAAVLAALGAWGTLSASWSITPGYSLFEGLRFLALSAAGLVVLGQASALSEAGRARVGTALLIAVALTLLLLQIELRDGQAIAGFLHVAREGRFLPVTYDRGLVVLVLAAWPAMALLQRRFGFWAAGAAAILVLLTLFAFYSQAASLAMITGLAAAIIAWRAPRAAAVAMIAGVVGAAFLLPLVLPDGATIEHWRSLVTVRSSAPHRLAIWHFVAERMSERPILGWGMDASRALPGGTALVDDLMPPLRLGPTAQVLPLHPHNAALQWRLELGLPGTIIALAFIALSLTRAARCAVPVIALAFAAAALTVALLSYGAWQAWWLSSLWLAASFIAAIGEWTRPLSSVGSR